MALRTPLQQCFKATSTLPTISLCRSFTSSASCSQRAPNIPPSKRRRRDPWVAQQALAQKAANLSRQEVLKKERAEALGDPIRGVETSFTKSFDNPPTQDTPNADGQLNFFVRSSELERGIQRSQWLMTPPEKAVQSIPEAPEVSEKRRADQENAAEALRRINKLEIGSSKDRLRVNIQRCINTFGRHNTNTTLLQRDDSEMTGAPRVGPDTGSSEVQISILTAKIRTLTQFLETRGKMDKHNRRNLQLLVHRRQKLMKYLQRKDKGGARWQNLIKTLGLTDGTWRGEITLPRYI